MSAEKVRNLETMFHMLTTKHVVALIRICNRSAFSCPRAATDVRKFALAALNPAKLSKLCNSLRYNLLLWLPNVRFFSRLAFSFSLKSQKSQVPSLFFFFRLGAWDLSLGTKRLRCSQSRPAHHAADAPLARSRVPVCFR